MLANGFGKVEGIPVDTHVKRLSNRIGFSSQSDPDKIEQQLQDSKRRACEIGKQWRWRSGRFRHLENPRR